MSDLNNKASTGLVALADATTGLATDPELARGKSPSPVRVQLGIAPQSLEEGWRLAQVMARSSLVPKNFQGKPEDVLVAIQLGIEVGFAPMQALQSIAVINGKPSVYGDGFLALIMTSPAYAGHDEYYEVDGLRVESLTVEDLKKDATAAVCTFHRRGKATPTTQRFTIGMAKKASLIGKEGPWSAYPDRMLRMRARSWAGRDAFPDALRGMTTAEEAMDIPPTPAEPRSAITMPKRLSETHHAPTASSGTATVDGAVDTVEPSGETSAVDEAEPDSRGSSPVLPTQPVGVLIKDVIVNPGKRGEKKTARVIDEHGVTYGTDDASLILAAVTSKDKLYRVALGSERRGDESVLIEITRVVSEATGK